MVTDTDTAAGRGRRSPGLVPLVASTAIGVYLLVVVGATTSLLEGALACPTWPACHGRWLVGPGDPPGLVAAWLHRVAAVLVGGLLLWTTVAAWRTSAPRRVRVVLGVAAALYPAQIALGGVTALSGAGSGASGALSLVHLVVAAAIFAGVLLALLWQLEDAVDAAAAASGRRDAVAGDGGSESPLPPPATSEPDPADAPRLLRARAGDYLELTKPRLWWLLCLVALAAMGLAGGRTLDPGLVAATLAGGVLAIAASGTFNNVLERDVDRRMARTDERPLVEGRVPVRRAVLFGLVLAAASVATLFAFVNALAAALGLLAILFYSVLYTVVLKPNTTQNIVLGGAVGAFPALIGWAAVTDAVGVPSVVLGALIFLWTPAHFYNLALRYADDYERAGFPMLPVVRGAAVTRRHVLLYLGATMLAAVALGATTRLDWVYAATAVVVGAIFVAAVVRLYRERTARAAFRAFHASNAYLGALLVAIVVDSMLV